MCAIMELFFLVGWKGSIKVAQLSIHFSIHKMSQYPYPCPPLWKKKVEECKCKVPNKGSILGTL